MTLLAMLIYLTLSSQSADSQNFELDTCRNYQTTSDFNQEYIDNMVANKDGYIVTLSNGPTEACQRLHFIDGNDFKLTFIDRANFVQNYTNRFTTKVESPVSPAEMHLQLIPRFFGANLLGRLDLYPLVATADLLVFISCTQIGLIMSEQVLVFAPYSNTTTHDVNITRTALTEANIPRIDELKEVSQDCVPGETRTRRPLPLRLYNLVLDLSYPFRNIGASRDENRLADRAAAASAAASSSGSLRNEIPATQLYSATSGGEYPGYTYTPSNLFANAGGLVYSAQPTIYNPVQAAAAPVATVPQAYPATASPTYTSYLSNPLLYGDNDNRVHQTLFY